MVMAMAMDVTKAHHIGIKAVPLTRKGLTQNFSWEIEILAMDDLLFSLA